MLTESATPRERLLVTKACPGCDLSGADLTNALLDRADLSGAKLSGAKLGGAKLRLAELAGADLSGADLRKADLAGADLFKANLEGTLLDNTELAGAYLVGTLLEKPQPAWAAEEAAMARTPKPKKTKVSEKTNRVSLFGERVEEETPPQQEPMTAPSTTPQPMAAQTLAPIPPTPSDNPRKEEPTEGDEQLGIAAAPSTATAGQKRVVEEEILTQQPAPTALSPEPVMVRKAPKAAEQPAEAKSPPAPLERLRTTNRCVECDLAGADFQGENFINAQLERAVLTNANFRKAKLSKANFKGANLAGADFSGADLEEADFYKANLQNANFQNADLTNASLSGADLTGASFSGADQEGLEK